MLQMAHPPPFFIFYKTLEIPKAQRPQAPNRATSPGTTCAPHRQWPQAPQPRSPRTPPRCPRKPRKPPPWPRLGATGDSLGVSWPWGTAGDGDFNKKFHEVLEGRGRGSEKLRVEATNWGFHEECVGIFFEKTWFQLSNR